MPERETLERAKEDAREGKSPSTQAGEFVHDEIEKIRKGKHGARSAKQAIAIGLSEARRAGVKLPVPKNASKDLKKKVPLLVKLKYLFMPPGWSHDGSSKTAKQLRKELQEPEINRNYF